MIEYVNFILLLAIIFAIIYPCYRLRKIFYYINIVMDSKILDQLTNLEENVAKEIKPKRNVRRKKKIEQPLIEEPMEEVDPEKRNRLINCVLSGNSKQHLSKEYTEQQIMEMNADEINNMSTRYESKLSGQMTKSLGKSLIGLYSNIACGALGMENKNELNDDLENDPFLNTALQRFTCDMYYQFGAMLAPVSVAMITGRHYVKNSSTNSSNNGRAANSGTNNSSSNSSGGAESNKTEESPKS